MRVDTAFVHRRRHPNVGDLACSPGNYFDLGPHQFVDFKDQIPPCKVMVLGGGQVFRDCVSTAILSAPSAQKTVVWGVGISPKDRAGVEYDLLDATADLLSTRNWNVPGCPYVPCASAMSPLFDTAAPPQHEVVFFYHATKSQNIRFDPAIPALGNDVKTMTEAIAFLASGATVVTNSYHGTYWAMCLGRRVLCIPFNQKFSHFPENPITSTHADWAQNIHLAEARPVTLDHARTANRAFYENVRNLY